MSSVPQTLRSPSHPLGAWMNLRMTAPHLFNGYELRGDLTDRIVLLAANGAGKKTSFEQVLAGIADYFGPFVCNGTEKERIRERRREKFGREPSARRGVWESNAVRRYLETGMWSAELLRSRVISASSLLTKILDWAWRGPSERVPLEGAIGANPLAGGDRLSEVGRLLHDLNDIDEFELVLPIIYGAGVAHMIPLPPSAAARLMEIPGKIAHGDLADAKALVFNDPINALSQIAIELDGVEPGRFVSIHLPAFVHALASPGYLMGIFSALPVDGRPLVPLLLTGRAGSKFVEFMKHYGFGLSNVRKWYSTVSALEPELNKHLVIALSARLTGVVAKETRRAAATDCYRDILERAAARTGSSSENLDAWLNWRYEWPQVQEGHTAIYERRFFALRDRLRMDGLLKKSLASDPDIVRLRRKPRRAPALSEPWDRVIARLKAVKARFAHHRSRNARRRFLWKALNACDIAGSTYAQAHKTLMALLEQWEEQGAPEQALAFLRDIDNLSQPRRMGKKEK